MNVFVREHDGGNAGFHFSFPLSFLENSHRFQHDKFHNIAEWSADNQLIECSFVDQTTTHIYLIQYEWLKCGHLKMWDFFFMRVNQIKVTKTSQMLNHGLSSKFVAFLFHWIMKISFRCKVIWAFGVETNEENIRESHMNELE